MKRNSWPTIERHETLSSTQERARQLAEQGAPEGTVVMATTQGWGRGRLGRSWASPPGGLWFSLVLRPVIAPVAAPGLNLLAAVVIAEAVRDMTGLVAGIKWPNDILVDGRKLGGILTEMKTGRGGIEYVLVGVGVNVNVDPTVLPSDLRYPAATVLGETGLETDLDELLNKCLADFRADYQQWPGNLAGVLDRWRGLSVMLGRRVTVAAAGHTLTGVARDIDSGGALLIVDDIGVVHTVHAGDVTLSFD